MKTGFMRMKVFDFKSVFLSVFSLFVLAGCVKSTNTPSITPGTTTIAGMVKLAGNLTLLDSAMSKAGLLPTLDSAGPYTLFAPVNIAFTNAGFSDSTFYKDSVGYLKRWILYHILAGYGKTVAILGTEIKSPNFPVVSASGDTMFLTLDSAGLFVNGNLVTQTDIIAKNGVIQALSGVLIPPFYGNIYQTIKALSVSSDTTLTYLVAALDRASASTTYTNLDTLLSSASLFTILAPTNAAFQSFGDTSISQVQNANPDTLSRILQCHLMNGRVFSSDFPQAGSLVSIAGDSLAFSFGPTVRSPGDSTPAAIIGVNRLSTNGVIHKVNQILNY
jgi:uncharacterized surface protein with fasciclin (FAS1) repeats